MPHVHRPPHRPPDLPLLAMPVEMPATVTAYDPVATHEAPHILGNEPRLCYGRSPAECLDDADALVIVTEWQKFRGPTSMTSRPSSSHR